MNFILSLFLCFALALSGSAGLPAEPETAATWTIRSVTLSAGDESYTLNPEARITTAIGAEKAAMHFEIGSDGREYLPISAEITNDALTFSLTNGNRAYTLTNEEFMRMALFDDEDAQEMDLAARLITNYGALLGLMYRGEEPLTAYSEMVFDALYAACDSSTEATEIELDGETLKARRTVYNLTPSATLALVDELRSCGIDELEALLDTLLEIINLTEDEAYPDYTSLGEALLDDMQEDLCLPLAVTRAEGDGLSYVLVETSFTQDQDYLFLREQLVARGNETDIDMTMLVRSDYMSAGYVISEQVTGPLNAPEAFHMTYNVTSNVTPSFYQYVDDDYSIRTNMRMELDGATVDGLQSAALNVHLSTGVGSNEEGAADLTVTANEGREDDGSTTVDLAFAIAADGEEFGLTFELNRAESAYESPFDGKDIYEITEDMFDSDDERMSPAAAALTADAALLSIDAMQLAAEESVQALMGIGSKQSIPSLMGIEDDRVYSNDGGEEWTYYGEDSTLSIPLDADVAMTVSVDSLEEAAEYYTGRIPDFTPPEGYEIQYISVHPYVLYIVYASDADSFRLVMNNYDELSSMDAMYAFTDGALAEVTDPIIGVTHLSDDRTYVSVGMPDGLVMSLRFDSEVDLAQLEAILAGFN